MRHRLGEVVNQLLSTLPLREQKLIERHLELVQLQTAELIYKPGDRFDYAYFPLDAVLSLLAIMGDGATIEMAMIGREGMFGIPAFIGDCVTLHQVIAQLPGYALRMKAETLKALFYSNRQIQRQLLYYTHIVLAQVSQSAVCNRFHTLKERLCRCLLITQDRVKSNELQLTQEILALMLGTRRAGVTVAAGLLQRAGLIQYARGHIKILDRNGLESSSCECYKIVKNEFDQLLKQ